MDKRDKKIRRLEDERNHLMAENQELKYIINDIQSGMTLCVKILKRNVLLNVVVL